MSQQQTNVKGRKPQLGDFIVPYDGALADATCQAIIDRFEQDPRRQASLTAAGVAEAARSGSVIDMAGHPEWADLKKIVTDAAVKCLHDYARRFTSIQFILTQEQILVSPPMVEKIGPGQGFDWHIDSGPVGTARRFLSALTYLNTVNDGGRTEFPLQDKALRPRRGTMALFPPYWLFPHRGAPCAAETKYKLTCYFMVPERKEFHL